MESHRTCPVILRIVKFCAVATNLVTTSDVFAVRVTLRRTSIGLAWRRLLRRRYRLALPSNALVVPTD
jgi:hypothetical protein